MSSSVSPAPLSRSAARSSATASRSTCERHSGCDAADTKRVASSAAVADVWMWSWTTSVQKPRNSSPQAPRRPAPCGSPRAGCERPREAVILPGVVAEPEVGVPLERDRLQHALVVPGVEPPSDEVDQRRRDPHVGARLGAERVERDSVLPTRRPEERPEHETAVLARGDVDDRLLDRLAGDGSAGRRDDLLDAELQRGPVGVAARQQPGIGVLTAHQVSRAHQQRVGRFGGRTPSTAVRLSAFCCAKKPCSLNNEAVT